ncbi:MAG TPA: YceI family protein [Caulobacteraceae bacterium]|jgi:polyisoprenoid-binding protein YceI
MKALLAAVLLSLAAGAAWAAAPAWRVDPAASSIHFASSFSGTSFGGRFSRWSADIHFDPADLAASSVTISIDTASAASGDADRDQALPTTTFLDVAQFPKAVFAARRFRALGGGRYVAEGLLTLRGVTRPLSLPFTLVVHGDRARMTGQASLDRLLFGVGQDQWRSTEIIPAKVEVSVVVSARRG